MARGGIVPEAASMHAGDSQRPDVGGDPGGVRCVACGDVIGVYEPLVHVLGDLVSQTSRAAHPGISTAAGHRYHLACYEARADEAG